ncbi:MAG: hypothetical protein HKN72_12935 [Gemmatimonadetes bacterium]|nr:hypothetical protein [Gemmatimonadota bacterium]
MARSPEMKRVTVELAALAVARVKQKGRLKVRQKEQLRRAIARAGETLGWSTKAPFKSDPVGEMSKEVAKLVRNGARRMKRDIGQELEEKGSEIAELKKVVKAVEKLAADPEAFPTEVTFQHTARHASQGLVTKTETLELEDKDEATKAAKRMKKRIKRWSRYRDQMLEELEMEREYLKTTTSNLKEFVDTSRPVLGEVLATMH